MKKLPIGMQTFSEMREKGYVYVDKTKYIHKLATTGKAYFLSRPRRFGKSLLLSTLEEFFKGNKELFKGLYIHDKGKWDSYPVLRLDFTKLGHESPEILKSALDDFINMRAKDFSIELISKTLTSKFSELIEQIHKTTGKRVVVLIDEYDKAINNHFDDIELAKKNRDVLKSFYQALKGLDNDLRFLFIAGISKFAKTSIFSELNQLEDITIHPKYSEICGYSQEDLPFYFKDHILKVSESEKISKDYLLNSLKTCYNGYSWDGKNFLYNPFSILNFFSTGKLANYWADSGTPTLLIDILKTTDVDLNILANKKSEFVGSFPNFELDNISFATVLLQTGYLTIKKEESKDIRASRFTTGIPNKEVEESLFSYILATYTNNVPESIEPLTNDMIECIYTQDGEGLQKYFEILLGKISNINYGYLKDNIEAYYKVLLISWMQLLGFDIETEVMTLKGRLDALLKTKDFVLIIEFKFSETKSLDSMLNEGENQILEKEYYKPYQNKNIVILSVALQPKDINCKFKTLEEALKQN